jgi:SulP family sulfate permease
MSVFEQIKDRSLALILYLGQVPSIDATGLVALETLIANLKRHGHKVILCNLRKEVEEVIARAGIVPERGRLAIAPDLDAALSLAMMHEARKQTARAPSPAATV